MQRQCQFCNKSFTSPQRAKWCSNSCRHKARRQRIRNEAKYQCEYCKCWFNTDEKRTHKYCSIKCRGKACSELALANRKPDEPRKVQCIVCNKTFEPVGYQLTCSDECRSRRYLKQCNHCGEFFRTYDKQRLYCSGSCSKRSLAVIPKTCKECGKAFKGNATQKCCSKKCSKRQHHAKRRATKKNAFIEPVGLGYLLKRDNGICQICLQPVDVCQKAPHSLSPSVDHIIPLAKGGKHSRANTQLAHFYCNSVKSDKIAC